MSGRARGRAAIGARARLVPLLLELSPFLLPCLGPGGCAHAPRAPAPPALADPALAPALAAWELLESGQVREAEALLARRARPEPLGDLLHGMLELEALRPRAALPPLLRAARALASGEGTGRDAALEDALATAVLARLRTALHEAADRESEDAVLALPGARLSARARAALQGLADEIARRRGDVELRRSRARADGCPAQAQLTRLPRVGRLPVTDLLAAADPPRGADGPAGELAVGGCVITLLGGDDLPGVERLRARLEVTRAGPHDLVIEYPGLAALRVDGGAWRRHGAPDRPVERLSAFPLALSAGVHEVEVRLASSGGALELQLALRPADAPPAHAAWLVDREWGVHDPEALSAPGARLLALLSGLAAEPPGQVDLMAARAALLGASGRAASEADAAARNPLVRAARARWALLDPTVPASVARDRARRLLARELPAAAATWQARADLALSLLEHEDGRSRPAERLARRALARARDSVLAAAALQQALAALGIRHEAEAVLEGALAALPAGAVGAGACALIDAAAQLAAARGRSAEEEALVARLASCDATSVRRALWLRGRGRLDEAAAELARLEELGPAHTWLARERIELLVALGQLAEAEAALVRLVGRAPHDGWLRVQLADLRAERARQAGASPEAATAAARATLADALAALPRRQEVRQAARLVGLPGPLDPFRVDGLAAIAAYRARLREPEVARVLAGPAVMVLDRLVERVWPDGGRLLLTHNIVQVHAKDALARWGEVALPAGAEVLRVRTIKADGRVLSPEAIGGKESISAPELEPGDFVEWETLEAFEPTPAFAPGFLGTRFYFQSFDLPFARSEYLIVHPDGMSLVHDRTGDAPEPVRQRSPDGTWIVRFEMRDRPQRFAEAAGPPAREILPTVRVGGGDDILGRWRAFVHERLTAAARGSVEIDAVARRLRAAPDARPLPERLAAWVARHIESEGDADGSATAALARGRGSRIALALALARSAGVEATALLARPLDLAPATAPGSSLDIEDYTQVVLGLRAGGGPLRYTLLRGREGALGVLPPQLDGAPALPVLPGQAPAPPLRSEQAQERAVELELALDARGDARARVVERLSGTLALEWADYLERLAGDTRKLRREFERGWLARALPGAALRELTFDDREVARGGLVLRYTADWPAQAELRGGELTLVPRFFRVEPGRRFASEPARRTTLQLSYDVPLSLDATITFPAASMLAAVGPTAAALTWPPGAADGFRFEEARAAGTGTGGPAVTLRRRVRVPYLRVAPGDYPAAASRLREVDTLESAPLRARLSGAR